jgi:4-amino-4-deoxy-L-arabinose transferase-like glycosyltransferase
VKSSNTKREGGVSLARVLPGLVLAAGLLLAFAIRLHRLDMPLERDEGEYAYAGQLILEGVPPYAEVDNVKLPGTYYAYALLLSLFGRSAAGIHLGLAIWTTASALALFFVGRSLFGPLAGASAAAALALLGVSEAVLGLAAHATHFVVLPTAIGCLLLLRRGPPRGRAALAAGVALGLAFLMKQQAVPLVAFGAAFVVWRGRAGGPRRWIGGLCAYATGAALPYLVFCLYAWRKGVFESFWFWTVEYAGTYVSMVSPWSAPAFLWDALLDVTR